ncbi:hypothetical protein NQ315_009163 [Exocentrus adspersus]|uniref:Tudor domain-containing protein n=1 Tax=Exocentrus adspersus TaxID=1586481 RepID=A0AAV8WFY3_9CUCU|nr:hypothetical protein NQ315_009163 [Exocentrus adspersus]
MTRKEIFLANHDYCNVHGQPLVVLESDNGDLYVNLKDIRRTGFAIYRTDTFSPVLVDSRQIEKEFELHLLSEAKNYILTNRVACLDEEKILKTIERCKSKLLGDNARNSFGTGRSVAQASGNITITSSVRPPLENHAGNFCMEPEPTPSRPPKSLPNNFTATHTQRGKRENNSKYNNNYTNANTHSKADSDLNSSNSSETKTYRRPRNDSQSVNKSPNSPRDVKEKLPRISFEQGNAYDVLVSFKEKDAVYWVQDKNHANDLEDVILKVNDLVDDLDPVNPQQGQLVVADYEGMWNRGRVMNAEPLIVHFVDYGNKSGIDLVKPLPDCVKTIPALAARITLSNSTQELSEGTDLKIKIKKKYEDGTYLVDVLNSTSKIDDNTSKIDEKPSSSKFVENDLSVLTKPAPDVKTHMDMPKRQDISKQQDPPKQPDVRAEQKIYFDIPKSKRELCNADKVMMVDIEDNAFLVRTRECALKSKEITEYIKNLDKSALVLTNVKVGQLVLCSKDGFAGLFRAVVLNKENDSIVTVKYIDFPGEDDLSIKSLRNVDEFLANEPSTVMKTPEYKYLEELTEKGVEYLLTICQNKQKFTVILTENTFDLQSDDGSLLSDTLENLNAPKPPIETLIVEKSTKLVTSTPMKTEERTAKVAELEPTTAKNNKILYDDMNWIEISPGTHTLMCYCLQEVDNITFLSSTDEVIGHLETVSSASPTNNDPYQPEVTEMCLVSFKGPDDDEPSWNRAVVLSVDESGYLVNFVDFGNQEVVQSQDIRNMPIHLKKVPILGITCECVGLPKKPEILERLKELLPGGSQVEVVVKEFVDLKYQIEIPELYQQLKAEKLFN